MFMGQEIFLSKCSELCAICFADKSDIFRKLSFQNCQHTIYHTRKRFQESWGKWGKLTQWVLLDLKCSFLLLNYTILTRQKCLKRIKSGSYIKSLNWLLVRFMCSYYLNTKHLLCISNYFFQPFSTFFQHFKPFSVISRLKSTKNVSKRTKKRFLSTPQIWSTCNKLTNKDQNQSKTDKNVKKVKNQPKKENFEVPPQ